MVNYFPGLLGLRCRAVVDDSMGVKVYLSTGCRYTRGWGTGKSAAHAVKGRFTVWRAMNSIFHDANKKRWSVEGLNQMCQLLVIYVKNFHLFYSLPYAS